MLSGSILCRQGTQYAPQWSILCSEYTVALQQRPVCARWWGFGLVVYKNP